MDDPALAYEDVLDIFNEDNQIEQDQNNKKRISESVLKTLSTQLGKDLSSQVREVIAAAIGGIGLPEG
jgi:hypothetical protein